MEIILLENEQERNVIGAADLSGKDRSSARTAEQKWEDFCLQGLRKAYIMTQSGSHPQKILMKNFQNITEWKMGLNKIWKKEEHVRTAELFLVQMKNSVYIAERHWNIRRNKQMKKECIEYAPPVALN